MVKANEISVDGNTLAKLVRKAVAEGRGKKWVMEQTGLSLSVITSRIVQMKKDYPQLAAVLSFPKGKGKGTGKKVTHIDPNVLSELEAEIAKQAGNIDPNIVRENGMSLVNNATMTGEQQDAVKSLQSQVDINAPAGVGVEQLQTA